MSALLFLLLVIASGWAQSVGLIKQWDRRFGGTKDEDMSYVFCENADHTILLAGTSTSMLGGDKSQNCFGSYDYWVIKVDSLGNKVWDNTYGGNGDDALTIIRGTLDGGYILGGFSESGIGGNKTQPSKGGFDFWIVKINSNGEEQWDKDYGGAKDDLLNSLQQTSDGGYILAGFSSSGVSGDKTQPNWDTTNFTSDYWVVKIDSLGNKEWDKRFGTSQNEEAYAIIQTDEGGYLIGGKANTDTRIYPGDISGPIFGGDDYWIIKIDSVGNKLWDKSYGGTDEDVLVSMLKANNGKFLLAGYSSSDSTGNKTSHNCYDNENGSIDYWIVEIDSTGYKLWDRDFGSLGSGGLSNASNTKDGGFLLAGNSTSPFAVCQKSENNLGFSQSWVVKTDSVGLKQWDKTIFTTGWDYGGVAIETWDGCYAVANTNRDSVGGYKTQNNWDTTGVTTDFWMLTFCMAPTAIISIRTNLQMNIYPNPFTTELDITIAEQNLHQATITITNLLGQTVYTQNETNLNPSYTKMLDLNYLANGVYWVSVVVDGERVTKEVIKSGP